MTTALERLQAIAFAPSKPFAAGPAGVRRSIEESLGVSLPDDIFDLVATYGSGAFGSGALSSIVEVFNPFSPKYFTDLSEFHDIYREHKQNEGESYFPYKLFPDRPGLLAWGSGENRRGLFWLTKGSPPKWPVIVLTPEHEFVRFDVSATEFLSKLFWGEIDSYGGTLSAKWFRDNRASLHFAARKR